jgi:hypothetical protein
MAGPRFSGSVWEEIRIVFRLGPIHAALPVRAGGSATGLSATGARMSLPVMIEPCASKMKSARAKIDNPAPNKKFWKGRLSVCGGERRFLVLSGDFEMIGEGDGLIVIPTVSRGSQIRKNGDEADSILIDPTRFADDPRDLPALHIRRP